MLEVRWLKKIIETKWPNTINNEKLRKKKTSQIKLSDAGLSREIRWTEHMCEEWI